MDPESGVKRNNKWPLRQFPITNRGVPKILSKKTDRVFVDLQIVAVSYATSGPLVNMNGDVTYTSSSYPGPPILPRPPANYANQNPHYLFNQRPPQQLQPRSCTECCRRKVRCDRHHPCRNCVRAVSECVFPKSRRAPVRQKRATKSRDEELLKSLQRLEQRLQSREDLEVEQDPIADNDHSDRDMSLNEETLSHEGEAGTKREEPARLVLDHDRSQYISNKFWASMSKEVSFTLELKIILDLKHCNR